VNAKRRVARAKELLGEIGIEPERVKMFNMSAAMAPAFVAAAQEMNEMVKTVGKNPLKKNNGA
jgi:F420-non-reducing hydrogenase iron-sulfur subunit